MISMSNFGAEDYWNKRYESIEREKSDSNGEDTDTTFDWYMDFHDLEPYLAPFLNNKNMEIFLPGCGNSSMGYELYKKGFHNVSNIDISQVVVDQMIRRTQMGSGRAKGLYDMEFAVMDATRLDNIPSSCFDLIMDKGLLDSLLCGDGNYRDVPQMVNEMHRVLAPGGAYLVVSHGQPSSRMRFLQQKQQTQQTAAATMSSAAVNNGSSSSSSSSCWASIECVQIPRPPDITSSSSNNAPSSFYYMYVCRKAGSSSTKPS